MTSFYRNIPGLLCLASVLALSACGEEQGESSTDAPPATQPGSDAQSNLAPPPEGAARLASTTTQLTPGDPQLKIADPDERPSRPTTRPYASTVQVIPAQLDLGTVAANAKPTGTVRLVNTGDKPITITDCKTNCGCTTTRCPKGQQLAPGESTEVDVSVTAGTRARKISKTVTFLIEGQPHIRLPVNVEVISYVTIEPASLNPEKQPDGRVVLRAIDGQPFRVLSVRPDIVTSLVGDPDVEHELFVSWDRWRELGQSRRLSVTLDHPKAKTVQAYIRVKRTTQTATTRPGPASLDRQPEIDLPADGARFAVAIKSDDLAELKAALAEEDTTPAARDAMLGRAARYGRLEMIDALLAAGANVEAKDQRGRTPLMSAIQSRNPEVVRVLIAKGADVNARDNAEGTALFRASGPFGNAAMVDALLAAGADVNLTDRSGMTPLIWAARFGDGSRATLLIEAGADVNARDAAGLTPLDYARKRSDTRSAELVMILESRADTGAGAGPAG